MLGCWSQNGEHKPLHCPFARQKHQNTAPWPSLLCIDTEELVPDEELRTRVMRWHIQKTSVNAAQAKPEDDDIYDF